MLERHDSDETNMTILKPLNKFEQSKDRNTVNQKENESLTTSILSSDASDFFALAFALAVMDRTAVVTWERKKKKIRLATTRRLHSVRRRQNKREMKGNIFGLR